jgi:fucose permease
MALAATAISLFFPWLQSLWVLFVLLFLSGIAAGPFWPSIQSDGARRVKGDYTMMMIMFSCAGVPGCGVFTTLIGVLGDWIGLRLSFLIVPACFLMVFVLMGFDMLTERREGGDNSKF